MKTCTKCNESKELTEFSHSSSSSDGLYGHCKLCRSLNSIQYYKEHKQCDQWYQDRKERNLLAVKRYKRAHPEKVRAGEDRWRKANPGKTTAYFAKYKNSKRKATPKWLTDEQLKEIQSYYELAKELQWLSNEELQVDHIVPIQGKNVCGLHVPWNLQILPESLNCSKGNKHV